MKKYLKQLQTVGLFALLVPALLLTGCNDDDNNTQPEQSIAEVVNTNSDFSLLRAAVNRAGIGSALNSGTLTVFAPNNAAFQAAGLTEAAINALAPEAVAAVLQYHVVNSRQTAASLPVAKNTAVTALNNGTLYVTKDGNNVSVNGARVVTADVSARNGVIHVIDKVLLPPAGNIVQIAAGNPNFTFLVAAVQRANVASVLSGNGPFTVFAPTNDAFINTTPFKTIEQIQAADPAALTAILTHHVVADRVFSPTLMSGNTATVQGGNVNVNLTNGVRVTGAGNGTSASNVVVADIAATNGVIHVIDRVLLPAN